MTIRVVFVLPALSGGGAERVILHLVRSLDRSRFTPRLVVLNATGPLANMIPDDVVVDNLDSVSLRRGLMKLRRFLAVTNPDAVVSTMGYLNFGMLLASWGVVGKQCRLIVREANTPDATIQSLPAPFLGQIGYRLLYRRADAVLCNAKRVAQALADQGVSEKRIHIVPNPVDEAGLRRTAEDQRSQVLCDPDKPFFVAAGRLVHQKGFDRLIDWVADKVADKIAEDANGKQPGFTIRIYGEGSMQDALTQKIKSAGLENTIQLLGFNSEPWPVIAQALAYLLPSRWEGMSNAALEALALGVPVIAHRDAGGIAELAAQAQPGAVQVTDSGDGFIAAMEQMVQEQKTGPDHTGIRTSLLPAQYGLDDVTAAYENIIAGDPVSDRMRINKGMNK